MMEVLESPAVIHHACNVLILASFCSPTLSSLLFNLTFTSFFSSSHYIYLSPFFSLPHIPHQTPKHTPTRTHTHTDTHNNVSFQNIPLHGSSRGGVYIFRRWFQPRRRRCLGKRPWEDTQQRTASYSLLRQILWFWFSI